ncbi:MAG TPA: hypothetical protein DCF62_00995 [Porticoccaceae bacterium]|nr:hypothetical protein [Porticoccaceae bacterium]
MRFNRYIGIDYSGARSPEARLKALQVYAARPHSEPEKVCPPVPGAKNWSRREVAQYCLDALEAGERVIIGIDHNFSLPMSYMERYGISDWEFFLRDFVGHWPTHEEYTYVEFLREDNPRTGDASEFRLCEQWTASAKSAFQFDVQGAVAKSTHAGLPWLLWLRQTTKGHVHFWPFDGFDVPAGGSVLAEAYPALYKRRYPKQDRSSDEHDAWSIAAWLRDADQRGVLDRYFHPPLTLSEQKRARLEGWILGVS